VCCVYLCMCVYILPLSPKISSKDDDDDGDPAEGEDEAKWLEGSRGHIPIRRE